RPSKRQLAKAKYAEDTGAGPLQAGRYRAERIRLGAGNGGQCPGEALVQALQYSQVVLETACAFIELLADAGHDARFAARSIVAFRAEHGGNAQEQQDHDG